MSGEPLEILLEKLSRGDMKAAEQMLTTYEPYLRMVVRRYLPGRLRAKFDSIDVVQSVWVHVLHGLRAERWHFMDRPRLLAFLVRLARRRLTSRIRHFHTVLTHEQSVETSLDVLPAPTQPHPSETVEAEELWHKLLSLCPPQHHELLRLRRMGLSLREVAIQIGMHEGSVRRILRKLARQLALCEKPCGAA